jgi:hypothetical protein
MTERYEQLLNALSELHAHYPDWRFGQLISNVAGWADENVWDIEDDRLLTVINEHLTAMARRKQEANT